MSIINRITKMKTAICHYYHINSRLVDPFQALTTILADYERTVPPRDQFQHIV